MVATERIPAAAPRRIRDTRTDDRVSVQNPSSRENQQRGRGGCAANRGGVTDVIASPPYLDTTNYREDQWLRLWFLGCKPLATYGRGDDRHYSKEMYWEFLQASWMGLAPLLAERARLVIRIGGRRLSKAELRDGLVQSLEAGLSRSVRLVDTGISSKIGNTQANAFRGTKPSQLMEHDFAFTT